MRTRFILLMLALAGAGSLFAQQIITPLVPEVRTKTDQFFKTEPVGNTNIKFHFNLPSGNRMLLEFHSIAQLDSLPDIDSLLAAVWKDLQNFEDSLSIPLVNRRVDYMHNINDNKIRILQYHQMGSIYSVRNGDVTQLKIEQD